MLTVMACPDLHAPWANVKAVALFYAAIQKHKPDVIIQLGDLYDMYSHSKFPRNHDIMTPKEEMAEARTFAEAFWKNCRKESSKKTRLIQILGNHDARPGKRVSEQYPEIATLLGIDHLFKFPGVESVLDTRTETIIDGVIYTHGHYTKHGQHAGYYARSVVHGHTHRGNVTFQKLYGKVIWELDCGHMADENAEPLQYTPTKTTKWTVGYGVVDEFGPRFVPVPQE